MKVAVEVLHYALHVALWLWLVARLFKVNGRNAPLPQRWYIDTLFLLALVAL